MYILVRCISGFCSGHCSLYDGIKGLWLDCKLYGPILQHVLQGRDERTNSYLVLHVDYTHSALPIGGLDNMRYIKRMGKTCTATKLPNSLLSASLIPRSRVQRRKCRSRLALFSSDAVSHLHSALSVTTRTND